MYEQQEQQQQSYVNAINRFRILRQIEQWTAFGLVGFVLFVEWVVIGSIVNPYLSVYFASWIYFAWFPWWGSWTFIHIIAASLATIWLSRFQQKHLIELTYRANNPTTDPSMPTPRPSQVRQETTIEVVEGELV